MHYCVSLLVLLLDTLPCHVSLPIGLGSLRYYFLHIPKTAGTSFAKEIAKGHIPGLLLCHDHHGPATLIQRPSLLPPPPLPNRKPDVPTNEALEQIGDSLLRPRYFRQKAPLDFHDTLSRAHSQISILDKQAHRRPPLEAPPNCTIVANERDTLDHASKDLKELGISLKDLRVLVMLREPESLLLSRFAHCQSGQGMKHHHYPRVDLDKWLELHEKGHVDMALKFCNFKVRNPQTHMLGGDEHKLQKAMETVEQIFFVGVVEHFDASLCLLRSLMQGRRACACPANNTVASKTPLCPHCSHETNKSLWQLKGTDRSRIAAMTAHDAFVYARACARLYDGLRRFELLCLLEDR